MTESRGLNHSKGLLAEWDHQFKATIHALPYWLMSDDTVKDDTLKMISRVINESDYRATLTVKLAAPPWTCLYVQGSAIDPGTMVGAPGTDSHAGSPARGQLACCSGSAYSAAS